MSEFDDPALRDQLQRLAGHRVDDDGAYAQLQHRVRVAKRRRASAAIGAFGAACIVGITLVSLREDTPQQRVSPADTSGIQSSVPGTTPASDATPAVVTAAPSTSTSLATSSTVAGGTPSTDAASTDTAPSITDGAIAPSTAATSPPGTATSSPGSTDVSNPPSTEPAPPSTSNSPPAAPYERTYASAGGSVTVRVADGALTLVSAQPTTGYDAEVDHNEPDRIRVRFEAGDSRSEIEIRMIDGVPSVSTRDD